MARILLVDDYVSLRNVLSRHLSDAGHEVTEAGDGRAALHLLEQQRFDLVITDILMPDTDGIELLNSIRRSRSGLPVIAMSGGGRTLAADLALKLSHDLGAQGLLSKPVTRARLLDAVNAALNAGV